MERITYDDMLRDPALLQTLIEEAHRARAKTMHRLMIEPVKAFFTGLRRLKARPAARSCAG